MIAEMLQWRGDDTWMYAGQYEIIKADRFLARLINCEGRVVRNFGPLDTIDAAKAACEQHHQEAVARMLSKEARVYLRRGFADNIATGRGDPADDNSAIALLDRIEQEDGT